MTDHPDSLLQLLEHTLSCGADAADAIGINTVDINIGTRLRTPETIERSENNALCVRAFIGNKQAIVSATDEHPDSLKELAERVVAMAKAAPADPDSTLADMALRTTSTPNLDIFDNAKPSEQWLREQCVEAEQTALAMPDISNSEGADASYGHNVINLAIAEGKDINFSRSYQSSYYSLSLSVVAGSNTNMERDYDFSSVRHQKDLRSAEDIGRTAAERTAKRLNPRKVDSCKAPVIFDPRIGRSLLGTLASATSGSAVARGSSFLKEALHTAIFNESITIIDDPHIKGALGSRPFDAEGVANHKMTLIDKGELTSWLLDVRSANKLDMTTTGHASRGIGSPPSPSSSNLYMENGTLSPEELIKDIKSGLYVTDTFGMGVNTVTGDYSQGAAGFWIENGQIAYPVSEITIAGHLRDMFAQLTAANDLTFRYATNAPTLRVEEMTIAGS